MNLHQHYNFLIHIFRCSQLNSNISKKFILQSQRNVREKYISLPITCHKKKNIDHNYNSIENDNKILGENYNCSKKEAQNKNNFSRTIFHARTCLFFVRSYLNKKNSWNNAWHVHHIDSLPVFPAFLENKVPRCLRNANGTAETEERPRMSAAFIY